MARIVGLLKETGSVFVRVRTLMPCEYFLVIRRQRRPFLLANDDGLSLAGQYAGRGKDGQHIKNCECIGIHRKHNIEKKVCKSM